MTVANTDTLEEIERHEGRMLVRRFTEELTGETTLERATSSAQAEQDAIAEEQMTARVRALFEDHDRSDAVFHASESARLALEKTCSRFEALEQPSTLAKLVGRRSARATANEVVRIKAARGFVELNNYIDGLETTWKSNQGKFSRRFRSICGGLDAHKNAFEIFPSQNNYASVLCGSLSLIVSAAVNHDEIADTISEFVTKITQKAARASNALLLVRTQAIRELFSELYAQVFEFYSDAIEWYMQSKASRFFGSFNTRMKDRYEKTAAGIEETLIEMYREMELAHFAVSKIQLSAQERRNDIARQREQPFDEFTLDFAGRNAQTLLLGWHKSLCIEASHDGTVSGQRGYDTVTSNKVDTVVPGVLNRTTARSLATRLENFIVGSDGQDLFDDGRFWLPDIQISTRLHDFIGSTSRPTVLWVSSPTVTQQEVLNARTAAYSVLLAATQAEMPMISHFCRRPRFATLAQHRKVEETGLIGLVYSLINQLLQFDFEDDLFQVLEIDVEALDGSDGSWSQALDILSTLLRTTPHMGLCVIDGLNELAFSSSSAKWCAEFLAMLFAHQRQAPNNFRILLTTSGQSKVLQDYVNVVDRLVTQGKAREVMRGGRWIGVPGQL